MLRVRGGRDQTCYRAGDTLIVDRSSTAGQRSIVVAVIDGELAVWCPFSALGREDACLWGVVNVRVRDLA